MGYCFLVFSKKWSRSISYLTFINLSVLSLLGSWRYPISEIKVATPGFDPKHLLWKPKA